MVVLTGIELCAGVGMLGEGTRAAFEFLGHDYRTVCYVEREAPAASQLVTLMEAVALDPAPIWSDMLTFDGSAWRGLVDCVLVGDLTSVVSGESVSVRVDLGDSSLIIQKI